MVSFDGNIKLIANKAKGLNNNTVLSTFIDKEKNIWAGLDNGIAKIAHNSSISFLHGYFDIGSGYCIERKNGMVYLGTNQGLHCIDEATFQSPMKNTQSFTRINGTDGQVWSLFDDGSNNGLLCEHNSGAYAIEGNKARLLTSPNILVVWKFRPVPNRKDLLVAGISNGLILFQKDHNNQWQYKWKIEGFDESSMTIEWDNDGGLWITHGQQGIYKVFFDNDYRHMVKIESVAHFKGINNDKDITLAIINDRLVFVSKNGLYKLDNSTHTFIRHELSDYFETDKSPLPHLMLQDWYQIEMKVKGSGANNSWFDVYCDKVAPAGEYSSGGKRLQISTWDGIGTTPFDTYLTAYQKDKKANTGIVTFTESGTVYLVIRCGGNDLGTEGISADDIEVRTLDF